MINRLLRRLTVRGRVVRAFVVLLLLMTVSIVLMITNQLSLANRLKQVTDVEARTERYLLQASVQVLSSRVDLMRYMSDATPSTSEALEDISQATDLLQQAVALGTSSEQTTAIGSILLGLEEYRNLIDDVQLARTEGRIDDVTVLLFDSYRKQSDIEQRIETIVTENAIRVDETNAVVFASAQKWLNYLLIGYLATLVLSMFIANQVERSITLPVNDLRIGAVAFRSGNFDTSIPETGHDELSMLAQTFNQMAAQLGKSYAELEERVADRTRAVEERALQLRVAAEIARDAASVRELDSLLDGAVNLIRQRFSLYHVSIFLIDDLGKFAVLRAATGEAGHSLLQREYKLRVGEVGIVGYTTGMGAPRIVNDVDTDFVYRRDAMLPDTHSEMALPLKVGNAVIGALDVQSSQTNAFDDDDQAALQILADQLAVAIQNTRLVGELESRLQEINTLYRRYTAESLSKATPAGQKFGFQYDLLSVKQGQQELSAEVLEKLRTGQMVTVQNFSSGGIKSRLLAPLMLYDQMVGVLGFDDDDPDHTWSSEEVELIESVSSQVMLALDNARLLEETQLRSDQLRLLQDITSTAAAQTHMRELLDEVSHKLQAGLDVDQCVVALTDPGGMFATVVARSGSIPELSEEMLLSNKITLDNDPGIKQALEKRESTVIYGPENLSVDSTDDTQQPRSVNARIVIPLLARDETLGLIRMDIIDPGRRFSDEDLRLFDQLSLQISTAIEIARSFEQTMQRAERERLVSEVTSRMRATLNVETVLKTAVDEIFRVYELNEAAVFLTPEKDLS